MSANSETNPTQQPENPASKEAPSTPPSADGQDPRLQADLERIEQYRRTAHGSPNPQAAVLGGVTAHLLEIEATVAAAVRTSLADGGASADEIEANAGAIEMMIRLAKSIAPLEKLQQHMASVTYSNDPFKFRVSS